VWNPFRAARERQQREREAFLAALQGVVAMAVEQSKASAAQAAAFSNYLQLFQVSDPPEARFMNDHEEWRRELERLEAAGFPVEQATKEQLEWVLKSSDQ
jgi:hypothetical protein